MGDRGVAISGVGLLCPAGIGAEGASGGRPGEVPGFRGRAFIENRKNLKLMTHSVQLGVSAIRIALQQDPTWEAVPPERRGIYVGASPQAGDAGDLRPALLAANSSAEGFSLTRFAEEGIPLIHPLWLVRGLSNNIIGFASAIHDLQGPNNNYCQGEHGGWDALVEGYHAVAESRADLVVAGGADTLVPLAPFLGGRKCGDGAAFLVFRPAEQGQTDVADLLRQGEIPKDEDQLGFLGAATWPVALARQILNR